MSEKTRTTVWRVTVLIIVLWMARHEYHHHMDSIEADAHRAEDKAAQRIKDYMDCKGPACDNLYPDAAIAVKKAETAAEQSSK
jgi:hypothetical protein